MYIYTDSFLRYFCFLNEFSQDYTFHNIPSLQKRYSYHVWLNQQWLYQYFVEENFDKELYFIAGCQQKLPEHREDKEKTISSMKRKNSDTWL